MDPLRPALILLAAVSYYGAHCKDTLPEANLEAIKRHEAIFKDTVQKDLVKIEEEFDKFLVALNKEMEELRKFVEKNINDIKTHAEDNLKSSDEALDKNIIALEVTIKDTFSAMNMVMMKNLETLSNKTADERKMLIDWAHQRNHLQEDILKTDVALCAYASTHHSGSKEGGEDWVVTYYSHPEEDMDLDKPKPTFDPSGDLGGYVDNKLDWMVYNQTKPNGCDSKAHEESCAMEVLNRETGAFRVPANASGLYMFSFGVTMDVRDFDFKRSEKNKYQFRKNKAKVEGVLIYADAGPTNASDKVPGSMTVLLQLEQHDEVDVVQTKHRVGWLDDIVDYNPTFCGTLIHLEKASEAPGGMMADSTSPNFPAVVKPEMLGWNYTSPVPSFEDIKEFQFTPMKSELDKVEGIDKLEADVCKNWLGSTQNDREC